MTETGNDNNDTDSNSTKGIGLIAVTYVGLMTTLAIIGLTLAKHEQLLPKPIKPKGRIR